MYWRGMPFRIFLAYSNRMGRDRVQARNRESRAEFYRLLEEEKRKERGR